MALRLLRLCLVPSGAVEKSIQRKNNLPVFIFAFLLAAWEQIIHSMNEDSQFAFVRRRIVGIQGTKVTVE